MPEPVEQPGAAEVPRLDRGEPSAAAVEPATAVEAAPVARRPARAEVSEAVVAVAALVASRDSAAPVA